MNAKNTEKSHTELIRKRFRKRAGIEVVIGHLKSDHRLNRNRLKGFIGDRINVLIAAAAFNFRKWMRMLFLALKFGSLQHVLEKWIDKNLGSLGFEAAK